MRKKTSSTTSSPSRRRKAHNRITAAERYFRDISSGKIVASEKMVKLAETMLPRFKYGYKHWHYDKDRAERPIEFIERYCCLPSGKLGKKFELEDYEKAIIETAFGFVDKDGNRQFQEILVIIGRKNGKTSIAAALELYMLVADGEGAPQIYNVATSEAQASLGYGAAVKMVRQSPLLAKRIRKGTVVERKNDGLIYDRNFGYITTLSGQTRNLDGLDVHFSIIDELAAITNRDQYDLVKQGTGAREQPMLFCITTNGFERQNIFDSQYRYAEQWLTGEVEDDTFVAFVYELDSREEWTDEDCWMKANPGLGTVKKWEYLRAQVNKAKQDPSYLPTVLTKDFNIPENRAAAWLRFDQAVNTETVDMASMGFRYGIGGFDFAETTDLAAGKILCMRPDDDRIYEFSMYWLPEAKLRRGSGYRREADDVPYDLWEKKGLVRVVPGNKVQPSVFLEWANEIRDEYDIWLFALGIDPWHIEGRDFDDFKSYVGSDRLEEVRQGPKTFTQPMNEMYADLSAHRFVNNHNPVDEWCRMNVSVRRDINNNLQPDKSMAQAKNRIDGFMAELDAYVALKRHWEDYRALL